MRYLIQLRHDFTLCARPVTAFVLLGLFWGSYAAFAPVFKARIGVGEGVFGSLLLLAALGLISAMWLAPRFDRRLGAWGLPVAVVLLALSFLVLGLSASPVGFAIGLILAGTASGLTDVIMNARISEVEARAQRPMMNLAHAIFSFSYATSALITGGMREMGGGPLGSFSAYSLLALCLIFMLRSPPAIIRADANMPKARAPSLRDAAIFWPGLVVLIAFCAEAAMESWSALHIETSLGGRAVEGALGPFMLGVTMGIGRLTGHILAQRLPDLAVMKWAAVVTALGALVAAAAPAPLWAYLGFGLQGLGVSVIAPLALGFAGRIAGPHGRAATIARVSVIGFSGFLLAPAFMGWMAELASLSVAFGAVAGFVLLIPLIVGVRLVRLARQ